MARIARASVVDSPLMLASCVVVGGVGLGVLSAVGPGTVYGTVSGLAWIALAGALLHRGVERHRTLSWAGVQLGIGFRLVMAFLYIGIVSWFYGGAADYLGYQDAGAAFGEGLLRGELRFQGKLPTGLTVLFGLFYFMVGPDTVGMFVLSALLGFSGAYLVLRACQIALPEGRADQKFLSFALFALPSFALWTSVLGKESLMLFFLGLTTFSFANILVRARPTHYVGLVAGVAGAMMTRSAIGAILIFSLLSALVFRRPRTVSGAILRPVFATLAVLIAAVSFWTLTLVTIEERFGGFGQQFAEERDVAAALEYYHRGLTMDTATPGATLGVQIAEPTVSAILSYVPKGVFALFFRPFVFEAWNPLALAAALESTLLLVVLVWRLRRLLASVRHAVREPFLAFCWIAGLLLAVVLSMGSNFGVMIRQRGMVLPFLFILLSIVPERFARRAAPPAIPPAP